ncbi:MAG: alpha-ketoglutarate-dependent dioxygenase AlkB [Steroidobacteraceae bacterium]
MVVACSATAFTEGTANVNAYAVTSTATIGQLQDRGLRAARRARDLHQRRPRAGLAPRRAAAAQWRHERAAGEPVRSAAAATRAARAAGAAAARLRAPTPLRAAIAAIAAVAPFRNLRTPSGTMSVAMTNCGPRGWPQRCPRLPLRRTRSADAATLARDAGRVAPTRARGGGPAGFAGFEPDACLVNRYAVGAQMGAHRDHDELDLRHPIVSVSIGLPATFLWYGERRGGTPLRVQLEDGDVVVWGGASWRLSRRAPARAAGRGCAGRQAPLRYNLTFRRAR